MNFGKKIAVAVLLIFCLGRLKAQDQVIAKVFYKFSHVVDTTNPNYAYTENMVLLLSKNSSEYKSYDRMVHDSVFIANPKNTNSLTATKMGTGSGLFLFTSSQTAIQSEVLINKYVYPIEYPKINWQIMNDTSTINGLACQKAIGVWKGRTYEVWFCPDLPFNVGPWKLCGLPGLVLNGHDLKNQVKFEFAGLQKYAGSLAIVIPSSAIKTTKSDYKKLHEAFLENPTSFIKGTMPQIGEIKLSSPYVRLSPINNPLELEK